MLKCLKWSVSQMQWSNAAFQRPARYERLPLKSEGKGQANCRPLGFDALGAAGGERETESLRGFWTRAQVRALQPKRSRETLSHDKAHSHARARECAKCCAARA